MYRSAIQDDPFFFDAGGFSAFIATGTGTFPRPKPANPASPQPGEARNFFGPSGNTFAIILEIPSARIAPNGSVIGVWVSSIKNNVQMDRQGRPAINTALIPPVPRNNLTRGERRNAFNAGHPRHDFRDFRADMVSVLMTVYGRTQSDANNLTGLLLPDVLQFQIGNPGGFGTFIGPAGKTLGNGRRLSNDVIDTDLTVITNGAITTDNVGDDNGLRVTDGSVDPVSGQTRAVAFPYIGAANTPGTGPNP